MAKARHESQDEVQRRIAVLESFLDDLKSYWNARDAIESAALRSKINRSTAVVREIVVEAGCMKLFTIAPPPAFGGFIQRNVDPFASLFQDFYGQSLIPRVIDTVEEAIGVVQSPGYLEQVAAAKSETGTVDLARGLQRVERICRRFPQVARQLQSRHDDRPTLSIEDEYDVQDLLHALLRIDFDDVRSEEWTPSYAGKSARMDFLLKAEKIVVEVKKTRPKLGAREVGDELLIDIARYRAHPDCRSLVCFVYDPEFRIGNPAALETLSRTKDDMDVRIVIAPSDR